MSVSGGGGGVSVSGGGGGVFVGTSVAVGSGVFVGTSVAVGIGVKVMVGGGIGVFVGGMWVGILVGTSVAVKVERGRLVPVGVIVTKRRGVDVSDDRGAGVSVSVGRSV